MKVKDKLCMICGSKLETVFEIKKFTVYECQRCSHRMIFQEHVEDRNEKFFSDDYFLEGGGGYTDYHLEKDLLLERGRQYSKILTEHHGVNLSI